MTGAETGAETVGSEADPSTAPLREHIQELRRRLIWIIAIVFLSTLLIFSILGPWLNNLVQWPVLRILSEEQQLTFLGDFIVTSLPEALFTLFKLAFYAAIFVTSPFVLYQIWRFVAPGLIQKEQAATRPFLMASPFLFFAGASLCYFIVMPWAFKFLISFAEGLGYTVLPKIDQYAAFFMRMVLGFGIAFQLPVALSLLTMAGLVRPSQLAGNRKYAVVACLIASALLTPPDGITMAILFIPLYGLFELSIVIGKGIERRQIARNPYLDPNYHDEVEEDLVEKK